ncbi:hypothetical protein Tco_0808629 [Tanacetum coccineum]
MTSESASASTATGVGSTSAPTVGSNTTLRNHITHPHCEAKKAQQNQNPKAGQTSMARVESVFRYDPNYLREQFAGLVIQRALPFNHFIEGVQPLYYAKYDNPTQSFQTRGGATSSKASDGNKYSRLLSGLKAHTKKKTMTDPTMCSEYERYVNSDFITHLHPKEFASFDVLASESAFLTSGRVLSIRRTRLTLTSLEMCMCLKDHLDAKERKQDKCPLEIPLVFEEDVFDDEVKQNEAIPLSDEEITLDASSEGSLSLRGPRYDYMMSSEEAEDDY